MPSEPSSCEFPQSNAAPEEIAELLRSAKTIAVVGLSPKPERPSYGVARYLQSVGYKIIPVNPGHQEILGEKVFASLTDIPGPVDIVDVFRRLEAAPEITEQAIQIKAKALWLQEGIVHNESAQRAQQAGLLVIQNKCIAKVRAAL